MTLKRGKTLLDDALSALKRKKALLQMNNLLCECSVLSLRIRGSSRGEILDVTRSSSRLRLMYRTSIHPSILGLCLLSAVQYILCFLSARRLPAQRPFRSHQATVSPGGKKTGLPLKRYYLSCKMKNTASTQVRLEKTDARMTLAVRAAERKSRYRPPLQTLL